MDFKKTVINHFIKRIASSLEDPGGLVFSKLVSHNSISLDPFVESIEKGLLDISKYDPEYCLDSLFVLVDDVNRRLDLVRTAFVAHLIVEVININYCCCDSSSTSRLETPSPWFIKCKSKAPSEVGKTLITKHFATLQSLLSESHAKIAIHNLKYSSQFFFSPGPERAQLNDNVIEISRFLAYSAPQKFINCVSAAILNHESWLVSVHLLQVAYLDSSLIEGFDMVWDFCRKNPNEVWSQQLLLISFSKAISNWIATNPLSYIQVINTQASVSSNAKALFYFMSQYVMKDSSFYFVGKAIFVEALTVLLCLVPGTFKRIHKDKESKFLSKITAVITKDSPSELGYVEACSGFVSAINAASILQEHSPKHPIVNFVKKHEHECFSKYVDSNIYDFGSLPTNIPNNILLAEYNSYQLFEKRVEYICLRGITNESSIVSLISDLSEPNKNFSLNELYTMVKGLQTYLQVSKNTSQLSLLLPFVQIYVSKLIDIIIKSRSSLQTQLDASGHSRKSGSSSSSHISPQTSLQHHSSKSGKLYGETKSLARSFFKYDRRANMEQKSDGSDFQVAVSSSTSSSDENSSFSALDDLDDAKLYDNIFYQRSMTDPVVMSKKILRCFFSIVELSPQTFRKIGGVVTETDLKLEIDSAYHQVLDILFQSLVCALHDTDNELTTAGTNLLKVMLNPGLFLDKNSPDFFESLSYTIDYNCQMMSSLLMHFDIESPKISDFLETLSTLYHNQIHLIKISSDKLLDPNIQFGYKKLEYTVRSIRQFEEVFFYVSCSPDVKCIQAMESIILELDQGIESIRRCCPKEVFDSWELRVFHEEMAKMAFKHGITGIVSFRRRVKLCFEKYVLEPSASLKSCWLFIYDKWLSNYIKWEEGIGKPPLRGLEGLAKFLSASCGILLYETDLETETYDKVCNFIDIHLGLLINDDLIIQSLIKNIIVDEIHPNAYKLLAKQMQSMLQHFLEHTLPSASDDNKTNLADATLSLVRILCKRGNELLQFELSREFEYFVDVHLAIIKSTDAYSAYQMKIKASMVICDYYQGNSMFKMRNMHVSLIANWLEDCLRDSSSTSSVEQSQILKLIFESSRAFLLATKDLKLSPLILMYKEEIHKHNETLLNKIFEAVSGVLNRYSDLEFSEDPVVKQKVSMACENLVSGLGNLFVSNIEFSLNKSLSLGYNQHERLRVIFFKIFTKLYSKYVSLDAEKSVRKQLEHRFVDLIVENIALVKSLVSVCPSSDYDQMAFSLLRAFETKGKQLLFVSYLIHLEIVSSSQPSTVLRQTTVTSRALYMFTKSEVGETYLEKTVAPVIRSLVYSKEYFTLDETGSADKDYYNFAHFSKYLKWLVDSICQSINIFPSSFKYVCYCIRREYVETYPERTDFLKVVGAFVFLKFICPAIINGDFISADYIVDQKANNSAMLLAKHVQSLSNGSYTTRWPTNLELFDELESNLLKFLDEISRDIKNPECQISEYDFNQFSYLHSFVYLKSFKLKDAYIKTSSSTLQEKYDIFTEMDTVVSYLGAPILLKETKIPDLLKPGSEDYKRIDDFFSKYKMVDISMISSIPFITSTEDKSTGKYYHVFSYYYFQKYDLDPALACYIILQSLFTFKVTYTMVLDCTGYSSKLRYFPRNYLYNLIGETLLDKLDDVYIVNANTDYLRVLRESFDKNQALFGSKKFSRFDQINFVNTIDNPEYLDKFDLSDYTKDITRDQEVCFKDIDVLFDTVVGESSETLSNCYLYTTVLTIGSSTVQFLYSVNIVRETEIKVLEILNINEYNIRLVEHKPSEHVSESQRIFDQGLSGFSDAKSELESGKTEDKSDNKDHLVLVNAETGKKLMMISPHILQIMELLYISKNKAHSHWHYHENVVVSLQSTPLSSTDVYVGDILNLAFAGVLSNNSQIRYHSILLVKSVMESLFPESIVILDHLSQEIPEDLINYVIRLSSNLAKSRPELTFRMINGFLHVFNGDTCEDKLSAILVISPWIGNIYTHVYCLQEFDGVKQTNNLIKDFVRISPYKRHFRVLKKHIWYPLSMVDELAPMILDAVVAFVNESYFINSTSRSSPTTIESWGKFITIVTECSNVTICSRLVNRLIDISKNLTTDGDDGKMMFEVEILFKMCNHSFFDSRHLYTKFFAQVAYIALIYCNVGSKSLKTEVYQLACSLFAAFQHDESGNKIHDSTVDSLIEFLNHDTAKLVYGFHTSWNDSSSPSTSLVQDRNRIFGDTSRFQALCSWYLKFIDHVNDKNLNLLWKSRFMRYVTNTMFYGRGVLHPKSLLIFGLVALDGVSRETIYKISEQCLHYENKMVNGLLSFSDDSIVYFTCLSQCIKGIKTQLAFISCGLWVSACCLLSSDIILYEASLKFFINTSRHLQSQIKAGDIKDRDSMIAQVFQSRKFGGSPMARFEMVNGFQISVDNYELYFVHLMMRGLRVVHLKNEVVNALKEAIKLKKIMVCDDPSGYKYSTYLTALFVMVDQEDFWSYLDEIGVESNHNERLSTDILVPDCITRFLLEGEDHCLILWLLLSYYYKSDSSETEENIRFLGLLRFVAINNIDLMKKFYPEFSQLIYIPTPTSPKSIILVSLIMDIFRESAGRGEGKKCKDTYIEDLLVKYNLTGVKNVDFSSYYLKNPKDIEEHNERFQIQRSMLNEISKYSLSKFEEMVKLL